MRLKSTRKWLVVVVLLLCLPAGALEWRTAWSASAQNPYPVGYPTGQPDLSFAFPDPAKGANDQSFRMVMAPTIWGEKVRIRFTNAFGVKPVTIDGAYIGLHRGSAAVVEGTNQPIRFGSSAKLTLQPGETAWSDAVDLPFVRRLSSDFLFGRKLAVSFHIAGESGLMTWHALGQNTSYISKPKAGVTGDDDGELSFPFGSYSWYFVDAVDMLAPSDTQVIACFGDSITDGEYSTLNGDDRWPDILARIANARFGNKVAVINAAISGNEVVGPVEHSAAKPYNGGPSAIDRIDRDLLSLSGVNAIIWLEGINDLRTGGKTAGQVEAGMRQVVDHVRRTRPGIRIFAATLVSSLDSTIEGYGTRELDAQRRILNDFIRTTDIFDGVIDFDSATFDPNTGKIKPEYGPDSAIGRAPDWLHPNRAGYLRMAEAVNLDQVLGLSAAK
ncbi:MAG: GDSL-type esterase/lipase family protein [Planctomycetota bacterium]|jgi:lysophospholipase L1-like esterase|nr:GDSL-type esterase/lipase family protein [Planctomycetota bacterium]